MKNKVTKKKSSKFKNSLLVLLVIKRILEVCTMCENFFCFFFLIVILYVITPPAKKTKYSDLGKCVNCFVSVNLALSCAMH